jgi:glyoxalase/bleomycin resistance protein/dioxygenase superfamily protein
VKSATPVSFVDRVEPTRDFFRKAGFEVLFDIPDGDRLGFAGLAKDGVQVMVETRGNPNECAALQALTKESRRAVVFIEVDDLDAVVVLMKGAKVLVERHQTFHKSDEISYEEPGGNVVTFARFPER